MTSRHKWGWLLAVAGLLALTAPAPGRAQSGTLTPSPKFIAFTDAGAPCAGCKLYTYASGTSTPLATYSESTLTTPNANPVVMDAAGRATIYLSATSYKFILKTSADVTIWTVDPVTAVNLDTVGLGSRYVFGGDGSSPITGTSYPSGATFDKLHPGTGVFNEDSANLSGTYFLEATGVVASGTTLTVAIMNLSDGAPDTPLASLTITSTTGARALSSTSITFAASGSARNYGIKVKVDTGTAFAWSINLRRTA